MEELLIGNSLIILFWVYITFIVDVTEKTKVIVLMYLITFITNIFNVVPTKESYVILIIALFIQFEFFEDNFKKIIIKIIKLPYKISKFVRFFLYSNY